MKKNILLLASCFLLLTACETDFDVTSDWKEIAVVYGILDKNDTTHYIRINKAYLGEEDAYVMAAENDSINFSSLTVKLFESTESGTLLDSFLLEETSVSLESGPGTIFGDNGNPLQKLWKTNAQLDSSKIYKLKIINNFSGNVVTSETPVVRGFSITQPTAGWQSKISFVGSDDAYSAYGIKFGKSSSDNGKVYEVTVVFYYRDVDLAPGGDTILHSLSWKQAAYVSDGNEGGTIQINLEGESFYNYVQSNVDTAESNHKYLIGKGLVDNEPDGKTDDHIDIIVNAGAEELYNYIEINKPAASGVLLDKPVYTNIENGLGIFSSRTSVPRNNKGLSVKSINKLITGEYTGALGFTQE